jgi:TctA family transporter
MSQGKLGRWAFIIGLVISIILGFVTFTYASLILVILGVIVGILNVSEKDASKYLIAVIAMVVIGIAGLQALSVLGTLYISDSSDQLYDFCSCGRHCCRGQDSV